MPRAAGHSIARLDLRAAFGRITVVGEARLAAALAACLVIFLKIWSDIVSKPPPDMDPAKGQAPTFENRNDVPIVYFDIAPAYGVMSGIVQIELGARILVPH